MTWRAMCACPYQAELLLAAKVWSNQILPATS
jgi:hypothetical protein